MSNHIEKNKPKNCLDENCLKCAFYNEEKPPLYCDFTLDPNVTPVRCSILKKNIKIIKFKEKLL